MLKELVTAYEALWERRAPIEEIVAFCREQVEQAKDGTAKKPKIYQVWLHSFWGDMVFLPSFLNALSEHDDELLCQIGVYISKRYNFRYYSHCMALLQCTRRILSMKYVLSDKIRGFFWHQMRRASYSYHISERRLCDSMFSDNPSIRKEIIRRKTSGYELIPKGVYFLDVQRRFAIPDQVKHAIIHDSASLFDMAMTLSGKKMSRRMLQVILEHEAENIVSHLLKNRLKAISAILTPQDLFFCICANNIGKGDKTVPSHAILDTLEELMPGICRNTIDQLGNTPLWYCLYDEDSEAIAQTLLKYGCDPDKRNHLNLSYNICREAKQYYDQAQRQAKEF
ncbi:MAG: ankyrin repeat domain-containing protein [Lentisphaeria bacterium]|jgi:hypothetical protein